MTERKPAGVSFESWVDAQIREARERGEFDNLPGAGKPLANVDGHDDDLWWVKQWLKRENVTFTPQTLALRKSVEDMLGSVGRLRNEQAVRDVVEELNSRIRAMNRIPPSDGPPTSLFPLDVEDVVERWRGQRSVFGAQAPPPVEAPQPVTVPPPAGLSKRAVSIAMMCVTFAEVAALELLFHGNVIARVVGVLSIVMMLIVVIQAWNSVSVGSENRSSHHQRQ